MNGASPGHRWTVFKTSAIISYTEEDGDVFMTPHFVAINDKMLVTDLEGNSPGDDPDDKCVH